MMTYRWILASTLESVAVLTLNRPEALNAWHAEMRAEVVTELKRAEQDPSVRAIMITGAGEKAFCAGQDLSETQKFAGADAAHDWLEGWTRFYEVIRGLGKPLVAALNGVAAGSAFQVAIMADVRVGHGGVTMGQPEINSGIPSTLGPWLMVDRIGLSRTIELTLTGRMMPADECLAIGLIHHLVAAKDVLPKALEIARLLAAKPPLAMKANKARFAEVTEAGFREALAAGHKMQAAAFASGEPQEYMSRFFEARAKRRKKTAEVNGPSH
jgi:enoyl-CoA hydratase/carnithine racemase